MATNNPKVSAYISPHIFDCFKAFYESQNISMSQAVAIIFAEYFEIDKQENHNSGLVSSPLLDRITTLEEKITSLSNCQSELTSELLSNVRLLTDRVSKLEKSSSVSEKISRQSKPESKQLDLIESNLKDDSVETIKPSDLLGSLSSEPLEESVLPLEESVPLSALLPIQGKLLVLRLGTDRAGLSTRKKELSEIGFSDWIQERDIDHIRWVNLGDPGKRSKGYVPADDTPSELLDRLRSWILENQDVKS